MTKTEIQLKECRQLVWLLVHAAGGRITVPANAVSRLDNNCSIVRSTNPTNGDEIFLSSSGETEVINVEALGNDPT